MIFWDNFNFCTFLILRIRTFSLNNFYSFELSIFYKNPSWASHLQFKRRLKRKSCKSFAKHTYTQLFILLVRSLATVALITLNKIWSELKVAFFAIQRPARYLCLFVKREFMKNWVVWYYSHDSWLPDNSLVTSLLGCCWLNSDFYPIFFYFFNSSLYIRGCGRERTYRKFMQIHIMNEFKNNWRSEFRSFIQNFLFKKW